MIMLRSALRSLDRNVALKNFEFALSGALPFTDYPPPTGRLVEGFDGLKGYWPLNDADGYKDISGQGNDLDVSDVGAVMPMNGPFAVSLADGVNHAALALDITCDTQAAELALIVTRIDFKQSTLDVPVQAAPSSSSRSWISSTERPSPS